MHRTARLAVWLASAIAAVVAFQVFLAVDEGQPAGTRSAFEVERVDTATKSEALDLISETATDLGLNVFKVQPDQDDSTRSRVLYAFIGDEQRFADRGDDYPDFDAGVLRTTVLRAEEITTQDLRGRYVTDADARRLGQFLDRLTDGGLVVVDDTTAPITLVLYGVAQGNLAGVVVITALALGVALFSSVAGERKTRTLLALHGFGSARIMGITLAAVTRTFVIGVLAVVVAGAPLLAAINGFAQVARFARVLTLVFAVLYLLVLVLTAVSVLALRRGNARAVIQGDRASLRVGALAALAQVAVLAIVVATTSAAMARLSSVDQNLEVAAAWSNDGPLYTLRLSVTGTHEDDLADAPALASVITAMEQTGQVVLTGYKGAGQPLDSPGAYTPEGSRSVLVNEEYLRRQPVLDTDGDPITPVTSADGEFTLIVPTSYRGDVEQLLAAYTDYFRDFACVIGRPQGSFACAPTGHVVRSRPGHSTFLYNGTQFLPVDQQDTSFLTDPVVAVVAARSELISPLEYLSYVSRDDVLFSDASALHERLEAAGVAEAFQGIDNAADAVAISEGIARRQLRMDAVSIGLGGTVLVISSIVMVTVYCDRRLRAMFVHLVHGSGFLARHRAYLIGVVALSAAGAGIALAGGGIAADLRGGLLTAGFTLAQLAVAVAVIRVTEDRFRSDYIKR